MDPSGGNSKLSVSPLLTLQFSNLVIQGDILITNVLPEILTASAEVGIDWEGWWRWWGNHAEDSVRCFIWVLQEQASLATRWCSRICAAEDHLDYNISHCHCSLTICSFHGENWDAELGHKNRLDKSHEYFSFSPVCNSNNKKMCSVQRTSKNPHASLLISISYCML